METPSILHVEVGGSVGGSLLSLAAYLERCDANRFRHELLFYRCPPQLEQLDLGDWHTADLKLPIRDVVVRRGDVKRKLKRLLESRPRLYGAVSAMREGLLVLRSLPETVRLARYFRRLRPAIVHCDNSFTYQVPTVLGAWLAGKPLVSHFRTLMQLSRFQRWLARIPVRIVAINKSVAAELRRQGVQTPIAVCYDPIEIPTTTRDVGQLRAELLGDGNLLVGTITRLDEEKGVEDLLVAAHRLRSEWPGLRFVIVGDGPGADALHRRAKSLSLDHTVRFTGFRPNVFDYLTCFDVFVCASVREGGPRTVLEAMRMGIPTISTRVGMVPELIRSGENGLMIDPSDIDALVETIALLASNRELRESIARSGMVDTERLCDPVEHAHELDEIFTNVLEALHPKTCEA